MITLTREEAQQVLDALQCATPPTFSAKIVEDWQSAVEFLRARLAQPEPEPVAWTVSGLITDFSRDFSAYQTKTYTRPLYTAPPQREWQGLTDEEIMSLLPGAVRLPPGWSETVRAIEAKLKEKNAA
jgi:hypothetical protein